MRSKLGSLAPVEVPSQTYKSSHQKELPGIRIKVPPNSNARALEDAQGQLEEHA